MLYLNEGPTPIYVGGRLIPPGVAREVDPALIPRPSVATAEDPAPEPEPTPEPEPAPEPEPVTEKASRKR